MARVLREDGMFRIEENDNYEPGQGNLFLMIKFLSKGEFVDRCIGSADNQSQKSWTVVINAPYNESTDSDAELIGNYGDRETAIESLWDNRHSAYIW